MNAITEHQLHLLHHTLGVNPARREPYRNYFVAGAGHHDQDHLEALEVAGLMTRGFRPSFLEDDDVVFRCTDAGRAYALENLPHPPKRTRFDEYMHSDCGLSFAEWLGIRTPREECNWKWGSERRYRYVRLDWGYRQDVAGEWKPTKKAAKASYKEALRRHQASQRAAA